MTDRFGRQRLKRRSGRESRFTRKARRPQPVAPEDTLATLGTDLKLKPLVTGEANGQLARKRSKRSCSSDLVGKLGQLFLEGRVGQDEQVMTEHEVDCQVRKDEDR